jgi:hypothetical protein
MNLFMAASEDREVFGRKLRSTENPKVEGKFEE